MAPHRHFHTSKRVTNRTYYTITANNRIFLFINTTMYFNCFKVIKRLTTFIGRLNLRELKSCSNILEHDLKLKNMNVSEKNLYQFKVNKPPGRQILDTTGVWGRQGCLFHNLNGRGILELEELNGKGSKNFWNVSGQNERVFLFHNKQIRWTNVSVWATARICSLCIST